MNIICHHATHIIGTIYLSLTSFYNIPRHISSYSISFLNVIMCDISVHVYS